MSRESITRLLESQYAGLLRLMRRKVGDEQLAADLLNDALVVTLEHLDAGRIADPELIAGYVFQVAMNLRRNRSRKHAERSDKRADVEADSLAQAESPHPAEIDWSRQVADVLRSLPTDRDRVLIKRFYLDEDDKESICSELGVSPLHFDKIMFRARQRLKALLEARGYRKGDFFSFALALTC